jgi:hypothetical protein
MRRYPLPRLLEEVAYVAHHLHWSHAELMGMEHAERLRWVAQARRLAADGAGPSGDRR